MVLHHTEDHTDDHTGDHTEGGGGDPPSKRQRGSSSAALSAASRYTPDQIEVSIQNPEPQFLDRTPGTLQGYLAHKKKRPRRTLQ